jgi:hypothetical protein
MGDRNGDASLAPQPLIGVAQERGDLSGIDAVDDNICMLASANDGPQ